MQVDSTTGVSTGASVRLSYALGDIRASPDHESLYYATFGELPAEADKFNITGSSASTTWRDPEEGGNGESLQLSADGSEIAFCSYQGGAQVFNASSGTVVGFAYNESTASISPDDSLLYTGDGYVGSTAIQIYSLPSFKEINSFNAANPPNTLFVSNDGQYLFSGEGTETEIFATGQSVPEPTNCVLILTATCILVSKRPRRAGESFPDLTSGESVRWIE